MRLPPELVKLANLGLQMVLMVLLFCGGGYALDRHLAHDQLWLTALGGAVGSVLALAYVVVMFTRRKP